MEKNFIPDRYVPRYYEISRTYSTDPCEFCNRPEARIVGGYEVDTANIPYFDYRFTVSLHLNASYYNGHYCGGSIINKKLDFNCSTLLE